MIWVFAVDGTTDNPGAKMYPAVICEVCDEPIHEAGLLAWKVPDPSGPDEWPRRYEALFLHKGRCDQWAEKNLGDLFTQELDVALDHIRHNFANPFEGNDLAEWKRAQPTAGYRPDGPALRR